MITWPANGVYIPTTLFGVLCFSDEDDSFPIYLDTTHDKSNWKWKCNDALKFDLNTSNLIGIDIIRKELSDLGFLEMVELSLVCFIAWFIITFLFYKVVWKWFKTMVCMMCQGLRNFCCPQPSSVRLPDLKTVGVGTDDNDDARVPPSAPASVPVPVRSAPPPPPSITYHNHYTFPSTAQNLPPRSYFVSDQNLPRMLRTGTPVWENKRYSHCCFKFLVYCMVASARRAQGRQGAQGSSPYFGKVYIDWDGVRELLINVYFSVLHTLPPCAPYNVFTERLVIWK